MRGLLFVVLLPVLLCISCDVRTPLSNNQQPVGWDRELALKKVTDINSDANIVEVLLQAVETQVELIPGKSTTMWTYNGTVPGPLIEAKVGDTLIVHFTNNLPQETTVHWHGLEVPADMDGSHIAQIGVQPGETFTYQFKLTRAATYWYHPHIRSNEQVEKGLYGVLVVRDPEEDRRLGLPENEVVLVLDDILLNDAGQIEFVDNPDPLKRAKEQANGREGNWFLVNGKAFPLADNAFAVPTLKVKSGVPIRFRVINAANARFFRFSFPDFISYQIGGDGGLNPTTREVKPIDILEYDSQGNVLSKTRPRHFEGINYLSNPDLSKGVMLVPGERADVVVTPVGFPGERKYMEWHYHDRGVHETKYDQFGQIVLSHDHSTDKVMWFSRLLALEFTDDSQWDAPSYVPPESLKSIPWIDVSNAQTLPITFGHMFPNAQGDITFFATKVNGVGIPFDQITSETALKAHSGGTYIWEVTNLTQGDHPFHPHGFSFQWLDTRYEDQDVALHNRVETATEPQWQDTIRIPGRPGELGRSKTVTRLAVRFDDTGREGQIYASGKIPQPGQSGGWFVHCHILEHSARGMATFLEIVP